MKKAELIIGTIALLSLVLILLMVPLAGVLTILSLSLLSVFYFYFSFALFNGIRLRNIFKKSAYEGVTALRVLGAALMGFVLSVTIMGILFKVQDWPSSHGLLIAGLLGLTIVLIVGGIRYFKTKSGYYTAIFKRIAVFGGLTVFLLTIPEETFLELRYRSHPGDRKASCRERV